MRVEPSVYPPIASDAELMLSSFGQASDRVSPLQMAMVSAAIANGGQLMKPTVVETIIAPDLTELVSFQPEVYSTPISQQTAATMTQMMVRTVSPTVLPVMQESTESTSQARPAQRRTAMASRTRCGSPVSPRRTTHRSQWRSWWRTAAASASRGSETCVAAPIAKRVIEAVLNR